MKILTASHGKKHDLIETVRLSQQFINSARKMNGKPEDLAKSVLTDMFQPMCKGKCIVKPNGDNTFLVYDRTETVEFSLVNAGSDYDIDEPAKPEQSE